MLKRLYRKKLIFILHIALVLILIGGCITYMWGESGMLSLRIGETSNVAIREDGTQMQLPFDVKLTRFAIKTYDDGKTHRNYISRLVVDGKECKVAMNHPYSPPFSSKVQGYSLLQMSYDSDLGGSTFLVQHDPWGIGITFCGYYLLLSASLFLFIRHCYRQRLNKRYWICLLIAAIGASSYVIKKLGFSDAPLMPVLNSPYLIVHVSIIIMAYTLMLIMLIRSLMSLIATKSSLAKYNVHELLLPSVLLLSSGIFIGAIWANESWGRYWGWDPKETWALITLIVYAFPLHHISIKIYQSPRFYHLYIVIAFLSVIITYFGVNYILGGLHSYT